MTVGSKEVMFDRGDGGGFYRARMMFVETDGETYVFLEDENTQKTINWIRNEKDRRS